VAPLACALMGFGVVTNLAQVGWTPSSKKLAPKLSHLNPIKGFKKMVSPQTAWEAGKTALKVALLAGLVTRAVWSVVPTLTQAGGFTVATATTVAGTASLGLMRSVAIAGLGLAVVDYALARRRIGKQIRMSRQEVKEESKQSDGDPQMKGAIRSRQLSMSRNRMMSEVARADVVIVNPTHVAVALRYEPAKGAPRVVAKGVGEIAARIRAQAEEHDVPIVRDVPLARTLHKACELGDEIPGDLFDAVARLLAFIFALRVDGRAAGTHELPLSL
jgi:flagellar biosynthesis protein FlhB